MVYLLILLVHCCMLINFVIYIIYTSRIKFIYINISRILVVFRIKILFHILDVHEVK